MTRLVLLLVSESCNIDLRLIATLAPLGIPVHTLQESPVTDLIHRMGYLGGAYSLY